MKTQIENTKARSYQTRMQDRACSKAAAPAISQGRKVCFTSVWTIFLLLLCVAASVLTPALSAQDQPAGGFTVQYKSDPIQGNTPEQAMRESAAGATIPMWPYNEEYCFPYNNFPICLTGYNGQMMGANPASNTTTNIPTYVVPVIVNLGAFTFDPTVADNNCYGGKVPLDAVQKSPLFNNAGPFNWGSPPVNFGTTQYTDALQRAEWYPGDVPYGNWHSLFQLHTTSTYTYFPPRGGMVYGTSCGGYLAIIDINDLYNWIRGTLIPSLSNQGVGPTTFPVILLYNVVENVGSGCCVLGYHSAYGSPTQVFAWAMFDTSKFFGNSADITTLSHELGEAMNDPTGANPTPPWGSGCQENLEVGDPLGGVLYPAITMNGYTYHPQELVMMPWFYHLATGLGWTSTNGTFRGYSQVCASTAVYIPPAS